MQRVAVCCSHNRNWVETVRLKRVRVKLMNWLTGIAFASSSARNRRRIRIF